MSLSFDLHLLGTDFVVTIEWNPNVP